MWKSIGGTFFKRAAIAAALVGCLGAEAATKTVLVTRSYTLPGGIYLAEKDGKRIPTDRVVVMYGGDVREFQVMVEDQGADGSTVNDYVDYSSTVVVPEDVSDKVLLGRYQESLIQGAESTIEHISGALLTLGTPSSRPRVLGAVRISALQPPSGSYDERIATYAIKLYYKWEGSDFEGENEGLPSAETPPLTVLVRPRDTGGGDGNDGGGSCNALSLSSGLLLLPTFCLLGSRRQTR
ncbi:MAG: hypothetical protein GX256_08555 [Fretibacterium sp.]|nr:hypothetical protein [Fretibacterium sp.]